MFTGIIQAMGRVAGRKTGGGGTVLEVIRPGWENQLAPGSSLAVDGVCLTVTRAAAAADRFLMDLGSETLCRTTMGHLRTGSQVNLERPLRMGDPLGGHLVQGHVDGTVHVAGRKTVEGGLRLFLTIPPPFLPYIIDKGSIAVNGVSLTVAAISDGRVEVFLIPFTLNATNLGSLRPGQQVNLELDPMGKYIARFLARAGRIPEKAVLGSDALNSQIPGPPGLFSFPGRGHS